MNATPASSIVAVDLAKSVFQLAIADQHWCVVERQRLTRTQFERWFVNRTVSLVVMEACGSAHHWARWLTALGLEVRLLPGLYSCLRQAQQDRCRRCLRAARSSLLRRYHASQDQVG